MKHLHSDACSKLRDWLSERGLPLNEVDAYAVLRHVDWLLETNPTLNLTAVTDPDEALRLHALDSLLAWPEVDSAPEGMLLDLGTGGGFPGLPLAIATKRRTLLIDSVRKKADAVKRYVLHENLDSWVSVSGERSEAVAREQGACAAVVIARAVAPLPSLIELATPLLQNRGRFIAMKGEPDAKETEAAERAASVCGMSLVSDREYGLPGGDERRRILVWERNESPEVALPRREGMAVKRPLGG